MTAERSGFPSRPARPQDGTRVDPPGLAVPEPVRTVRPAVPASLRGVIAALAAVSMLAVVALSLAFHGEHGPDPFDRPVTAAVRAAWPQAGIVAYIVDGVAEPVPAAIIVAALVVGCMLAKWWRLAVVAAVGPLSAAATAIVLKPLVMRTIHGDNLAFPSGHTAFATAVALLLGLILIGLFRLGRVVGGAVVAGLALVAGAVMSVNQVVLDAHYPSDTVGGFFTAAAVVSVAALLTDAIAGLRAHRSSAEAG